MFGKFLKIREKKIEKITQANTDFSSYLRDWEEFEQNNTSIALNVFNIIFIIQQ